MRYDANVGDLRPLYRKLVAKYRLLIYSGNVDACVPTWGSVGGDSFRAIGPHIVVWDPGRKWAFCSMNLRVCVFWPCWACHRSDRLAE